MKDILIAVDSGKHSTKSLFKFGEQTGKLLFRTKMQPVDDFGVELNHNSYLVQFQGKNYLIGDMVSENKSDYNLSKNSIIHQLAIYLSIAKLIEKSDITKYGLPNVHLAVNLPINMYKSSILKNEYQEMLQNNNQVICLKINNISYCFRIISLTLMPEAIGSIYTKINEFRDTKATIIDVGSLNTNYCTFKNLVPELDSMIVANSGTSILRAKIAETLKAKYGVFINDDDTDQILKDGCLYINGIKMTESIQIIERLIDNHVEEIFNFARSRNLTFNNSSLVFVGGGSALLHDCILKYYPTAIIEANSQFSNIFSYLKVLEIKHNGKK
jgi:plasmid segregation protein ParM